MKNGFSETVDKVLRRYGLKTSDCVGTYWGKGESNWTNLLAMGYRIEKGIINPEYDYVIISKENSTISNLLLALTRTKLGCIILFRADNFNLRLERVAKSTGSVLSFYSYGLEKDRKLLGVLFKGKETNEI
jgi:hypothetical protein